MGGPGRAARPIRIRASIVVTAPTRQSALVKARAALEDVVVEGLVTNLEVLKRVVAAPQFWKGAYDVHVVDDFLVDD